MKKPVVITIATHKGGSGKSSLTINLGYTLSKLNKKVLLIDTDGQMNLSHSYHIEEDTANKNFFVAVTSDKENQTEFADLKNHIVHTEYENLDIVVADENLATIETNMTLMNFREYRVTKILENIIKEGLYDYILFDTSPALGNLSVSILMATDHVIVPVEPSTYGLDGLGVFVRHFKNVKAMNSRLSLLGVILNKVDKREKRGEQVAEAIKTIFGEELLFDTEIVKDINVDNAQGEMMPVEVAYKDSRVVESYNSFAKEVLERVKEKE